MNLHTLHVEHIWLLVVCCFSTVATLRLQQATRGALTFSLYNVSALLGAVAVALRDSIPEFISVVLGNVFVVAAYLLLFFSVSQIFGLRRRQTIVAVTFFVLGAASMVYYGQFAPNSARRLFAYSLVLALQQAQIAIFLFVGSDVIQRRVSSMLAIMVAALAAANAVRMALILIDGVPENYLRSGVGLSAVVLANTCLQCGVVVAYIWMTAALLQRDLEAQASTNPLTGLLNRRALELAAERELEACRLTVQPLSALVIDLDDYKRINDQFGHAAGDATLLAVSRCLQSKLRQGDLLARTGGDEFVALLPHASIEEARAIAAEVCSCLREWPLGLSDASLHITGSFGVSQAGEDELWEDLLQRCDGLLYEGKRQGGDRVLSRPAKAVVASDPSRVHVIPAL